MATVFEDSPPKASEKYIGADGYVECDAESWDPTAHAANPPS